VASRAVLDLFSGIGAYSLGLERTGGFETVAFCESNAFCRGILRKHWPDVEIFDDVRSLTGAALRSAGIVPDWIVAGWPCQGNSLAGTGLGMDDPRSGLWAEIARLAGELRPEGLLLENSSNLLNINDGRDFGRVLGDLAALGFDAEWHCLPAAAFDAPHIRDRVWIIATLADASRHERQRQEQRPKRKRAGAGGRPVALADTDGAGLAQRPTVAGRTRRAPSARPRHTVERGGAVADANSLAPVGTAIARAERHTWQPEPGMGRVVAGCADRVERIHALGNLNPPVIPEMIGHAILEAMR
jgi:DNA (cytosine-5)-methyltransferase 1